MTPLQLIREGILSGNLDLVNQGYQSLTGENLLAETPPPPKKRGRPPKAKVKPVEVAAPVAPTSSENEPQDEFTMNSGGVQTKLRNKKVKASGVNTFADDPRLVGKHGEEDDMPEIDKLLYKNFRRSPRRPPKVIKMIDVTCYVCHRQMNVREDEVPVFDGKRSAYRCDKCCAG